MQAYIYAINIYITNPDIGQRSAAESTRKEFGLPTFSHSTLCRTFKRLEETIRKYEECAETCQDNGDTATQQNGDEDCASLKTLKNNVRRFPSVIDTADRRKAMSSFIQSMADGAAGDINEISLKIVIKWYVRHRRLLL